MIDHFLRDASGFCPARFGVLFCSVVLSCGHTPLVYGVVSRDRFLTGVVFECDIVHRRSVAVLQHHEAS